MGKPSKREIFKWMMIFFLSFLQESWKFGDLYWKLDWRAAVFGILTQTGTRIIQLWAWILLVTSSIHMPSPTPLLNSKILYASKRASMLDRSVDNQIKKQSDYVENHCYKLTEPNKKISEIYIQIHSIFNFIMNFCSSSGLHCQKIKKLTAFKFPIDFTKARFMSLLTYKKVLWLCFNLNTENLSINSFYQHTLC